ncbi:glycosyltransferase family 2 protein [Microlunatus flavus]|uniref:glycosyltransferase family 2 protein n=1 Tax=Microlunatus flavus TaxID=1036181 RepID=UPI00147F25B7|nr:glycosyltransferase [Microlunatus flavus]
MPADPSPATDVPEPGDPAATRPSTSPTIASAPAVVVGVATFRRPAALARLLPALVAQLEAYAGEASVLVVDNDPDAGAREEVARWAGGRVRYAHEPRPGIAAARNRALAGAGDARLLVFVDDDGLPQPGWLSRMVEAWLRWRPAAVSGPAVPRFEEGEPDPWVAGSGVFDRTVRPTGMLLGGASSANLLLDLEQLRAFGLAFDEAFGLTGGSDTMLTHAIVAAGGEIRWCDEAEVLDFHSPDRMTRAWVRRRSYRTGNDWSRVALALAPSGPRRLAERGELVARGAVRGATGLANQLRGRLAHDVARQALGACQVSTAVGVVGGALGVVSVEYGRPVTPG